MTSVGIDRYTLVQGDARVHRSEILDLLHRNLIPSREVALARYRKYYETNPDGPPVVILAQETESRRFVGTCAVFPTRLWVSGEVVLGGVGADFAVDVAHRGFGPAIALQRGLLEPLEKRGLSCVYGWPNQYSDAITERLGYTDLGRVARFVKFFDLDVVLERNVRRQSLARVATGVSSVTAVPILNLFSRERFRMRSGGFTIEAPARFDERFAAVWEAARGQHRVTTHRGAAFLNWKFDKSGADGAADTYSIFALVAGAEVVGYIVHTTRERVRHVVDVAFLPSERVVDALLAEFVLDARRAGASAVNLLHFGPRDILSRRLRAFGFIRRELSNGLRLFVEARAPAADDLLAQDSWCLFAAAQDI